MSTSHEIESVIISGASAGLGAATARALASRGYRVLGGIRHERDGEALRNVGVEPVILDVTKAEDIHSLASRVSQEGLRLSALINNAGYAANAPVEALPLDEWRQVFEVNVFGMVALTQALLPELRRNSGRVVNISSIGGRVAMPAFGAYSGSKFAVEAISDALRQEVAPQGVAVAVVEPGGMRTEMTAKGTGLAHKLLQQMSPEHRRLYGTAMAQFSAYAKTFDSAGTPADRAARVVVKAVTDPRPASRYTIGRDAALMTRIVRIAPTRVMDRMIASTLRTAEKSA